jgi:antitoxin HicB
VKKNSENYINLPYKIEIYYEKDDKSWIAFHPELGKASCYAIGTSKQEALELLDEERKSFIELLIAEGKEIPLPKIEDEELPSGQFVLRIPRSLHKKIKDTAENENISVNQFVLYILSEKIGEIEGTYSNYNFNTVINNIPTLIHMNFAHKNLWNSWHTFYKGKEEPKKIMHGISFKNSRQVINFDKDNMIYFRKKEIENVTNT